MKGDHTGDLYAVAGRTAKLPDAEGLGQETNQASQRGSSDTCWPGARRRST